MADCEEHEPEPENLIEPLSLEHLVKYWPRRCYRLDFPDMTIKDMCRTGQLLGYDSPYHLHQRSEAIIWFEGVLRLRRYKSVVGGFKYAGHGQHHVRDSLKIIPFSSYSEAVKIHYLNLVSNAPDIDDVDSSDSDDNASDDDDTDANKGAQKTTVADNNNDKNDEDSDKYRFRQRKFIIAVYKSGLTISKEQRLYNPNNVDNEDVEWTMKFALYTTTIFD